MSIDQAEIDKLVEKKVAERTKELEQRLET